MPRRGARESSDDDFFDEPDYDQYSDEELDELYQFGEIRSALPRQRTLKKRNPSPIESSATPEEDDSWNDDEDVDDLYED
ncbi:MAG: hypothetical protein HKN42_03850 [Granulosicoccus sp.]|nr:hypothetical protein [Granulosicoccus sp.]